MSHRSSAFCYLRNMHSDGCQPRTVPECICLVLSYLPMLVALGMMGGIMGPFFYYFVFDYAADTLWNAGHPLMYFWSLGGALLWFTLLLTSYFKTMCTPPLFADPNIWSDPPKVLGKDGVLREMRIGFAEAHRAKMAQNKKKNTSRSNNNDHDGENSPSSFDARSPTTTAEEDSAAAAEAAAAAAAARVPIPSTSNNPNVVTEANADGTPRFCRYTRIYKPDRSHYCSMMRRVVINHDHFCPWVMNSVGAGAPPSSAGPGGPGNHKFFLLFLIYIMFSGGHIASCIWYAHNYLYKEAMPTPSQNIANFLIGICAAVFASVLGLFALFHVFLVAAEETTIGRNLAAMKGTAPSSPTQKQWWLRRFCVMWCYGDSAVLGALKPIMGDASPLWQWPLPCYDPVWQGEEQQKGTSAVPAGVDQVV